MPTDAAPVPIEIGGYRIQRMLGSGGMATVYAALQQQPRRTVALKVLKTAVASDGDGTALRRFKREIEILGRLRHPNIAQVFEAGVHHDVSGAVPYLVMEYVPGAKTILEYVTAKQLSIRDRLKLFVKVCAAVEHGHRNKIIHRDLKPANILVDELGEPKVIDFGVAHATEFDAAGQSMNTEAGRLVGTLKYMSPEQLSARPVDLDARCDVYALGVLLYRMLTGRQPHDVEGMTVVQAVRILCEQEPKRPSEIKPELRGDLETIILKAMQPDRSLRYKNAGSLGRDIVRFLNNLPIHAQRASVLHRMRLFIKRHRAMFVAAGIAVIVMSIAASIVLIERMRTYGITRQVQQQRESLLEKEHELRERIAAAAAARASDEAEHRTSLALPSPFALKAHTTHVSKLAFVPLLSGDEHMLLAGQLASASFDHSVAVWDLSLQKPRFVVREFGRPVTHLVCTSDGTLLIAATDEGRVLVLDANDGRVLQSIDADDGAWRSIRAIAACAMPDGLSDTSRILRLAVASDDMTIRLMDIAVDANAQRVRLQAQQATVLRSTTGTFNALALHSDGTLLAGGTPGGTLSVWMIDPSSQSHNRNAPQLLCRFHPRTDSGAIRYVAFAQLHSETAGEGRVPLSSDSDSTSLHVVVVTSGETRSTTLLYALPTEHDSSESGSGNLVRSFELADGPVGDIAIAATRLAVIGAGSVQVWDLLRGEPIGPSLHSDDTPRAITIDAAGRWCAIGESDGDIYLAPLPER